MSRFSGKCDFYDHVFMSSKPLTDDELFEKFKGTKLYKYKPEEYRNEIDISTPERFAETMRSNWEEIHYESIADLVPYFPYLVSLAYCDNTDSNNSTIVLTSKSFVDIEEQESLELKLKEVLKIYNRCKRKKIEFDVDECVSKLNWTYFGESIYRTIAERVKETGKKATLEGIHLRMHERYRNDLVKEMLSFGLNPLDYGNYERFIPTV